MPSPLLPLPAVLPSGGASILSSQQRAPAPGDALAGVAPSASASPASGTFLDGLLTELGLDSLPNDGSVQPQAAAPPTIPVPELPRNTTSVQLLDLAVGDGDAVSPLRHSTTEVLPQRLRFHPLGGAAAGSLTAARTDDDCAVMEQCVPAKHLASRVDLPDIAIEGVAPVFVTPAVPVVPVSHVASSPPRPRSSRCWQQCKRQCQP